MGSNCGEGTCVVASLDAGQADAAVRQLRELEGQLGIADVHHHLRTRTAEVLETRALHVESQLAIIDEARVALGTTHRDHLPVLEPLGPIAAMRSLESDGISVTIWNLGYAGLGAESDFAVDGGKNYLPPDDEARYWRPALCPCKRGIMAANSR